LRISHVPLLGSFSLALLRIISLLLTVCDIGDGITVCIDLDLVEPLGREGFGSSRPPLEYVEGRVHVQYENRLAGISRLGESKQIGVVEAGVPTGKR
jgi:hypothetical protein